MSYFPVNPLPTTAALCNLAFFTGRVTSAKVVLLSCGSGSECEILETDDDDSKVLLPAMPSSIAEPALLAPKKVDKRDRYAKNVDIPGREAGECCVLFWHALASGADFV